MKEQESVSPPGQQLHWQNLSEVDYYGTPEFVEGLQLPGEELDSKLWLILTNFSS